MGRWDFTYWGQREFSYKGLSEDGEFIQGAIGKKIEEVHHDSPDHDYAEKTVEFWECAKLFLNLEDGQQVAGVQTDSVIGDPKGTFVKMIELINTEAGPNEYKIDVFPLHHEQNFFDAVANYSGLITKLELTYVVPNVFGGSGETRDALRRLKEKINARNVKAIIQNPDGLDLNDDLVKESVDYIANGGGEIKAKSGQETVYDSENDNVTITTEMEPSEGEITEEIKGRVRR